MRTENHKCGGTILVGRHDNANYRYCNRCGAFNYDMDSEVPNGTDADANTDAWDAGKDQSPDIDS